MTKIRIQGVGFLRRAMHQQAKAFEAHIQQTLKSLSLHEGGVPVESYTERHLPALERDLFALVALALRDIHPDIPAAELTCHSIARAVHQLFPVLVLADGRFNTHWEHSWLITKSGHILDPYPIACIGGALLLDGSPQSPWSLIYTKFPDGYYEHLANPEHTATLVTALTNALKG